MKSEAIQRGIKKSFLIGAIIILIGTPFYFWRQIQAPPIGEDEIYWIGQVYYYHLAFESLDWSHPDWQLLPARENPALGKYVLGQAFRLDGLSVTNADWLGVFYIIAANRPNAWGQPTDQAERRRVLDRMNAATREEASAHDKFEYPPQYLFWGRTVMVFFGVISILTFFVLTSFYANRITAFVTAMLFALHPAVVSAYSEVGADILAATFSLLTVLHFVLMERRVWQCTPHPRFCLASLVITGGLSLAFAVGSKMNASIVGILGGMICAAYFLSASRAKNKEARRGMFLLLVMALIIFIGTNPLNFPNPIKGIWALYADQQRSLEIQKSIPAMPGAGPLSSFAERLQALVILTALHPAVFGLIVCACLYQFVNAHREKSSFPIIAVWWALAFLMIVFWLPFPRPRYALPLIIPSILLLGIVSHDLMRHFRKQQKQRAKNPM